MGDLLTSLLLLKRRFSSPLVVVFNINAVRLELFNLALVPFGISDTPLSSFL
jgi:hypothetical protein